MGLIVHSLENIPKAARRNYFIYLLDYGWYEQAIFHAEYVERPEYSEPEGFELDVHGGKYGYCLSADAAHLIPTSSRTCHSTRIQSHYMDSEFRFEKYKQGEVFSQKIKPNKNYTTDRYAPARPVVIRRKKS